MTTASTEKLVPMTAYVPEEMRRRVKILAAKTDKTMRKIADEAFIAGLDLLEQAQRDLEGESHVE